jgi:16S rRNA (guanine966-N2)-methyltransferase
MADKVRGALFNTLGDIGGLTVLDAFAGTGALSFEAVSRGAALALAIENDQPAQRAITEAIARLGIDNQVRLVKAGVSVWSDNNPERQFDLVVADPPFDNLQEGTLQRIVRHVRPGGLYILCWPGNAAVPELTGMRLELQKSYGDAQLVFYRS